MNWKKYCKDLFIGLGMNASPVIVHAQENPNPDPDTPHHAVKFTVDTVPVQDDSTYVLDPILITISDSTSNKTNRTDSINISVTDSISPEQWSKLTPRQKLESCSNLMFLFNIQFEDLKAKAYNDGYGNPTILNGMAYIDGKKVPMNMSIKDFKKALETWNNELNRDKGFFDVMEAYLGPAISEMKPTTEKELLQDKSALCAWLSFTWHRGQNVMGSSLYANAINSSQRLAHQTENTADIARADSLFNKYAKDFVKDYANFMATGDSTALKKFANTFINEYNTQTVKKKVNGKIVKVKEFCASHDRRRRAEIDIIEGKCIVGIGDRPECLKDDKDVVYLNILETTVGGIHSIGKKLPEDWADKIQDLNFGHTVGDSLVTQYPKLRPEQEATNTRTKVDSAALQAKLREAFQKSTNK